MHKGRSYPYLREFWQGTCYFWPGFVPRKLFVQCPAGFGSSWDRFVPGRVTGIGLPDVLQVGDPRWTFVDPSGDWYFTVDIHRVAPLREIGHVVIVRVVETGPHVASIQAGEILSAQNAFGGWNWLPSSNFPPYSLGATVPLVVRPATWSEV